MSAQADILEVNRSVIAALEKHNKIELEFAFFDKAVRNRILVILSGLFTRQKQEFLVQTIQKFASELIINAEKANMKRVFLQKENLDISNPQEYAKGLKRFREEVLQNKPIYQKALLDSPYTIIFSAEKLENGSKIAVENNAGITEQEMRLVQRRIRLAKAFTDLDEIFEQEEETQEGAGLGLLLILMVLKNIGIPIDNFKFKPARDKCRFELFIPQNLVRPDHIEAIIQDLEKEIELIPTFPQNIQEVIQICEDPEAGVSDVTKKIEADPALASQLLKLANSALYAGSSKVTSLAQAAARAGLNAIRDMAVALSAKKIIESRYKVFQDFWKHANQTAFYAKQLADHLGRKEQAESMYISGLLHDLGKIILQAVEPESSEKIIKRERPDLKINTSILEEVQLGISHSQVGAKIAMHWHFPEELVSAIDHHHYPAAAPEEYRFAASLVHLADSLARIDDKQKTYYQIDTFALDMLNIQSMRELEILHEKLKKNWIQFTV
ncbi:MAG: HDOD domain-containing protein [Candidatus Hydrogenedentota bacterium]|nr:MAG: HDOD domain-containing protein [Candidatus Hydrogenedentota bacterium]